MQKIHGVVWLGEDQMIFTVDKWKLIQMKEQQLYLSVFNRRYTSSIITQKWDFGVIPDYPLKTVMEISCQQDICTALLWQS